MIYFIISEASRRLSYIETRDGVFEGLCEESQELSVTCFRERVDDTLLAHPEVVKTTDYTTRPNESTLALRREFTDRSTLYIYVQSKGVAMGALLLGKEVFIQETDQGGDFYRRHIYTFEPGILEVKRSDTYAESAGTRAIEAKYKDEEYWRRQEELTRSMTYRELADEASVILERLRANQSLERERATTIYR